MSAVREETLFTLADIKSIITSTLTKAVIVDSGKEASSVGEPYGSFDEDRCAEYLRDSLTGAFENAVDDRASLAEQTIPVSALPAPPLSAAKIQGTSDISAFALLYAIGYGVDSATRNSWVDVWSAYGSMREALGLPRDIPAGTVSRVAVTPAGGGQKDAPSYMSICRDVFSWLAKNPTQHAVTDRIMRGALGARIAQMQSDVNALVSPRRETVDLNPLVVLWRGEVALMRREYLAIGGGPTVTVDGTTHAVELDTDLNKNDVPVTKVTTDAPCVCGDPDWSYDRSPSGYVEQIVCECGHGLTLTGGW